MHPFEGLAEALAEREAAGLYRRRRVIEGAQGPRLHVHGRELLAFCSNDYLGLAGDPRLAEALARGAREMGTGSGAAHLVSGHHRAHHALEEELAAFVGAERALLFSTGYMANLGVIPALLGRGDTVIEDRLNHASLIDGARLSGARLRRWPHGDLAGLQRQLGHASGRVLVAVDAVFSMDGDRAPLGELARLVAQHEAALMIDDAHGFGVLGPLGRGSLAAAGLGFDAVPLYMATLGKALGVAGAFVAGSELLVETLIQRARPYVYTTAMPPALAEATRAALRIAAEEDWRRERLRALTERFRREAAGLGLCLADSDTPIQPLLLGDAATALRWSEALAMRGILVPAIRPPTVPEGSARLRITFSAAHEEADLDHLLEALDSVRREAA
ncbi:8-amino-7-oxononanoate synthase [endosymbiont of unidentified scaly snail isolate Monju]|uniref:8-amino-7-oxononanoate synthase n=1 Tax=endosymbiont of unidentified scaly snail isolate Monju TaxID=1248727 RepID=UPI0003892555|nr:8-amino-7-oxononanoate synthase [endosymbiont of unidentified scaly snail isolate Monju]BAN68222.1 8-amino-7-oxononanoate synthase [endosymbiont of unidentified scaly snail isolate Monju]